VLLQRVISVAANLAIVPMTLSLLGAERFAVLSVIMSVLLLASSADLGISNALVTLVARADGHHARSRVRELLSNGVVLLACMAMVMAMLFVPLALSDVWHPWISATASLGAGEVRASLMAVVLAVVLGIPLGAITRVLMGLQEGLRASLWTTLGSVISLVLVCACVWTGAGMAAVAGALALGNVLALATSWLVELGLRLRDLRPSVGMLAFGTLKELSSAGGYFAVIQLCSVLLYSIDAPILLRSAGPDETAAYVVTLRLYGVATVLPTMFLSALWPAYGEAIARGDIEWVRGALRRSQVWSVGLSALVGVVLAALGQWFVLFWTGHPEVVPTWELLVAFSLWTVIQGWGNAVAAFLNGAGAVRFQAIVAVTTLLVSTPLRFALASTHGGVGIVAATSVSYVLVAGAPMVWMLPRLLAGTTRVQ
jgi:O-antigen/teichoic acid export membrane protein